MLAVRNQKADWKAITIPFEKVDALDGQDVECYPLSPTTAAMMLSQAGYLTWSTRWHKASGELTDADKLKIREWAAKAEAELMTIVGCAEASDCFRLSKASSAMEWFPQNPYEPPPEGEQPAWRIVNSGDTVLLALGYQPGDILAQIADSVYPPDHLARFRLTVPSAKSIELEFLQTVIGGMVQCQRDGDITSLTYIELNLDLVEVPPENYVPIIQRFEFADEESHFVDVTFLPTINDEIPFAHYGGGLRSITVCGSVPVEECEVFDVRQNEETPCVLEKSDDGGETWVEFADLQKCPPRWKVIAGVIVVDPDGDGNYEPLPPGDAETPVTYPTPPRAPIEGQDDKCLAAANAVNVFVTLHAEVVKVFVNNTAIGIAAAILAIVLAVLDLPLILSVIIGIISSEFIENIIITEFSDFGTGTQHTLKCILFDNTTETDGVVTFDFDAVSSAVHDHLAPGIWGMIVYYLSIIGETGLNLAGATTAISEADCDCEGWCVYNDFTDSNGGFAPYGTGQGHYSSGNGWVADNINLGGTDRTLAQITLTFASTHITSVGFVYDFTGGQQSNPGAIETVSIFINGTQRAVNYQVATDGTDKTMTVAFDQVGCTSVILEVQCSYGSFGGAATIKSVTFNGLDDIPSEFAAYLDCP
jgi:hypothetical protein